MDLLQKLEEAARKLCDAVDNKTTACVEAVVKVHPDSKLVSVQYVARVGEVVGVGKEFYRLTIGESIDSVTDDLLNKITSEDIARSIRQRYLENMAEELGFTLTKKKATR